MKGWTKFLIIFVVVLAFVSVPVTFIILNNNGNVYTREQAYALTNKVCEDLGFGSAQSSSVSDYNEENVSVELMNYVKGSETLVLAMRRILGITDCSEETCFKWVANQHDYHDEDNDGDTDELIDWDYYYFKYKLIGKGVVFDFISIKHSEHDSQYKIVITITETNNGWEFDYYLTDYFISEISKKDGLKSNQVYHIFSAAENDKVYTTTYEGFNLGYESNAKNLYKDNVSVSDCNSFKYESINLKTKKHETITSSETNEANSVINRLTNSAKKLYSVNFENVENPKIVREEEIMP